MIVLRSKQMIKDVEISKTTHKNGSLKEMIKFRLKT